MAEAYAVETKNLSVGYDGKVILKDLNLSVLPGTVFTLIGPNGTGKSTILKTITRQLSCITGTVRIEGEDLSKISAKKMAEELSMMMTERVHTTYMTCRDVAAAGRYPYTGRLGILTGEDERKVDEAIALVHAEDVADKDFMKVSDGQRQRIMLARALSQDPRVLILDEPTSYLDLYYKLDLLKVIRDVAIKKGIAVIMSLHELDLAEKISDVICCIFSDGTTMTGTPEEIFEGDLIERLYGLPKGAYDSHTGNCFFPPAEGEPKVFLLGGGGSGIGIAWRLQREKIPFAAGIYMESDIEYPVAKALAGEVIFVPPFTLPGKKEVERARQLIDSCRTVITPIEKQPHRYPGADALIEYAKEQGKWQGQS